MVTFGKTCITCGTLMCFLLLAVTNISALTTNLTFGGVIMGL
jgi:hypothetical protein